MQANIIPFLLYALHLRPTRARTLTHGTYDLCPSHSHPRVWWQSTRDTVSVDQPRRWRPRVTPGHFVWTRTRRRRPAERDSASRGHEEAAEPSRKGTQDRRSRTSGESGRPAAHLPRTNSHARRARSRDATSIYRKHKTTVNILKLFYFGVIFGVNLYGEINNYFHRDNTNYFVFLDSD